MALNNGQYNEVMKIYEARQRKNRIELERRRAQIYEAAPRVADYDMAISEAARGWSSRPTTSSTGPRLGP